MTKEDLLIIMEMVQTCVDGIVDYLETAVEAEGEVYPEVDYDAEYGEEPDCLPEDCEGCEFTECDLHPEYDEGEEEDICAECEDLDCEANPCYVEFECRQCEEEDCLYNPDFDAVEFCDGCPAFNDDGSIDIDRCKGCAMSEPMCADEFVEDDCYECESVSCEGCINNVEGTEVLPNGQIVPTTDGDGDTDDESVWSVEDEESE